MADDKDEVVLKYDPANKGDFVAGVPARDLTERDLRRIEPVQLHAMTVPGASGQAMYRPLNDDEVKERKAAEEAEAKAKAEAAAKAKADAEAKAKADKAAKNAGKDGEA